MRTAARARAPRRRNKNKNTHTRTALTVAMGWVMFALCMVSSASSSSSASPATRPGTNGHAQAEPFDSIAMLCLAATGDTNKERSGGALRVSPRRPWSQQACGCFPFGGWCNLCSLHLVIFFFSAGKTYKELHDDDGRQPLSLGDLDSPDEPKKTTTQAFWLPRNTICV